MVYLSRYRKLALERGMKVKGQTFTFVVKKAEEGGYVAKCVELPQVHTEGETLKEVRQNMRDALNLALEHLKERARKEKGKLIEITV
jgi:predicted RNase H-like HicB family nuclease